ncbi:hypothetical protein [Terribacillus saccharophilus]|uniref:hypothetical protein n=1 Tax=Terribacillus saccharophilus TaxID=361277 RepID=UPI000BA7B059|nr:hypothetical protein [Terribacillus saccharophilus]PAF19708.1 hypothetical protein CHH51_01200 [Terribacillus saccharophilus]
MKKLLGILFAAMLVFVLAACGSDNTSKEEEGNTSEEETTANAESAEKEEAEPAEETTTEGGTSIGETVSNEGGDHTLVSLAEDVGTFESGPMTLNITKVNGVSSKLKGQLATMMDTEELEYIQVDMNAESSSDENVSFYPSQATLVTDTGEQLEPDMMMSEHMDGEFMGKVKKEGINYYILEQSKAADVKHVKLVVSGATDSNFEKVGEDITIETDLNQ